MFDYVRLTADINNKNHTTMKKLSKWLIVILFILPIGIISMILIMLKDSLQDIPIWGIIFFCFLFFLPSLTFLFTYRKIQNDSLKKRQKWQLMLSGGFIVFLLIMAMIYQNLWKSIWENKALLLLTVMAIFPSYLFPPFNKWKKQKPTDNNKLTEKKSDN